MSGHRSPAGSSLFLALSALLFFVFEPGVLIAAAASPAGDSSVVVMLDQRVSGSTVEPDAEQQLLVLLNGVRAQRGLPALRMDRGLQAAARSHSRDMAQGGFVGHGTPSGTSALDRLSHVVARGWVGENVTFAVNTYAANRALVASDAHLANMLDPKFHRVGIGIFSAGQLGMAITEDFAE
jgi:uncharacterized protein YkwD